MIKYRILGYCLFFVHLHIALAQTDTMKKAIVKDDYYQPSPVFKYENCIYQKGIYTVRLYNESFELSPPYIALQSDGKLLFSFDELNADFKNYSYTIIHCDAQWKPSGLMPMEYIDGFQNIDISDYQYSQNSKQQYITYTAYIPHPSMRITKSGNYILKVYRNNDEEQIVLSRRFMVVENKVNITVDIHAATEVAYRNYKQEVDFVITHEAYEIKNPFQTLKVVITQNGRWDNASFGLTPSFIQDQELTYNYNDNNVFSGGSEFRNFDIKSINYKSQEIEKIKNDSSGCHVWLKPDQKRSFMKYTIENDINGNFIIKTTDGNNSVSEEYCFVHFFAPYLQEEKKGNFYVFGAFNGWTYNADNKMNYNPERGGYEATLYLKQGYYNYEYVFLKNLEKRGDETIIEGMHQETENEYTIFVYYQKQGTFYDSLIGIEIFNSSK